MGQLSPFAQTGHCVVWQGGRALLWFWDAVMVQRAMVDAGVAPKRVPVWPESVMVSPGAAGLRLVKTLQGVEAQFWDAAGALVARFHRQGLDHADLNAHNLLFDDQGRGWMIDFDRSRLRIPATGWREANLARLQRSLHKRAGARPRATVEADFAELRAAYDAAWQRGY